MRIHRLSLLFILALGCSEDRHALLEQTETVIGPLGGQALSADGDMKLIIPRGALSEDTPITILTVRRVIPHLLVSFQYELGPEGLTFAVPIRVELETTAGLEEEIVLANFDGPSPEIVPGSVYDRGEGVVRAELEHFSLYGAMKLYEPCLNRACGDACSTCDPLDHACVPDPDTACDSNGMCVASSSVSCEPPMPSASFVVSPDVLHLAAQLGSSAFGTLTVSNVGDADGVIHALSISPPEVFSVTGNVPAAVVAGESMEVAVFFTPASAETATASLRIDTSEGPLFASLFGNTITSTQTTCTESFQQPAVGSLDVLMIVDNSGSMADEQAQLAASASLLLDALTANNLDFHIGVTTVDTDANGERGELVSTSSGIRIVDNNTNDPESVLGELVNVGFAGGAIETGFDAIELALALSSTGSPNAGFLRKDAWLAVIVVSDEDDGSDQSAVELVDFLLALKAPAGERMVRINGITGEANGCGNGSAAAAPRYAQAIAATGGVSSSICSTDWSPALSELGGQALGFPYKYVLRGQPMLGTIEVSTSVGPQPSLYDPVTNTIVVTGTVPPALSEIVVTYLGDCAP